jgi:hypothetical protein
MSKKNPWMVVKYKPLEKKEEHQIRRALLTGLNGWEFPPEKDHERQDKGFLPFFPTVHMAEQAMQELLKLKAEIAKVRADKAVEYSERFTEER